MNTELSVDYQHATYHQCITCEYGSVNTIYSINEQFCLTKYLQLLLAAPVALKWIKGEDEWNKKGLLSCLPAAELHTVGLHFHCAPLMESPPPHLRPHYSEAPAVDPENLNVYLKRMETDCSSRWSLIVASLLQSQLSSVIDSEGSEGRSTTGVNRRWRCVCVCVLCILAWGECDLYALYLLYVVVAVPCWCLLHTGTYLWAAMTPETTWYN